jgi:hypothetical protein
LQLTRQQQRHMNRLALRAVADLMTAAASARAKCPRFDPCE